MILIHIRISSDKIFEGSVVNRALPYSNEGLLEVTLTVPLKGVYEIKLVFCMFADGYY